MVKKKSSKTTSRYVNVEPIIDFVNQFRKEYPGLQVELECYDKHHGGTFVLVYGEKTICRIYPLLKGLFTVQITKSKKEKNSKVTVTDMTKYGEAQIVVDKLIGMEKMKYWRKD